MDNMTSTSLQRSVRMKDTWTKNGTVKTLLIIVSIIECLCFGGLPFGWSSLVYTMKSENLFGHLCSTPNLTNISSDGYCWQQDERLNLIYSIGLAVIFVFVFYIGVINTALGELKTRIGHMLLFTSGALFMAFTSEDLPWLLLPGLILIGCGGFASLTTNYRVASLLTRGSPVYICLLIGSFDSSAVILLVVKILYDIGVSQTYSFVGLAVLYILISGFCTTLHWLVTDETTNLDIKTSDNVVLAGQKDDYDESNTEPKSNIPTCMICSKTWLQWICSVQYLVLLLWMSVNVLNLVFFLGTLNSKLEIELKDKNDVNHFTNVFGYVMPAGMISSFLVGLFQEWQIWIFNDSSTSERQRLLPLVAPICVTSALGALLGVLSIATATEWTLYMSFVVFLFYRAFLFSVNANYIVTVFPQRFMTLTIAINVSIAGILSFLQYPLYIWRDSYDGATKHVNILLIALCLVSVVHGIKTCVNAFGKKKEDA